MLHQKLSTLITTYNKKTWKVSDDVFYLGRWCIPYDKEKNVKLDSIQNFHWKDKDKFQKDYKYLEIFYENVLKDLCNILNKFHNTDFSLRSWRIILGPWLISILPIFWDRYENLRIFFKNKEKINTKIIKLNEKKLTPFNYRRFINVSQNSDNWNHYVYGDLIKKVFFEKSNIEYEEENEILYEERLKKTSLSVKDLIKAFFGNEFFIKNKKFLINDPYLPFEENVILNYGLGQFPYWLTRFDENIFSIHKNNINLDLRKKLSLNIVSQNDYESYIKKNLISYIPMSYLENFKFYYNETEKIKFTGKNILSSGDYYSNDLFKIWLARQIIKKKSFYISSHGGGIPIQYDCFGHDEVIADKKIVWHKPFKGKQIQLPPLKIKDLNFRKNSKKILLLFYPWTSKYVLRAEPTPQCTDVLEDFEQKIELINFLKPEISKFIKARILQSKNWNLEKRFIDLVGNKYLDVEKNYFSSLKNTKLVISAYPSTPFTEAIALNKPTICLMIDKFWPTEIKFENLKNDLKKNKIIFNNPIKAAEHIKSIYNNIDDWWQSREIRDLIKFFREHAVHIKKNKIEEWTNFFKFNF